MEDLCFKIMMTSAMLSITSVVLINMSGEYTGKWWQALLTWVATVSLPTLVISVIAGIWV